MRFSLSPLIDWMHDFIHVCNLHAGKASMHKNAVVKLFEGLHGEAAAVSEDDDGGLEGARARAKEQIEKI